MSGKAPVGVVGIGLIGGALAKRLIDAGHPVFGFDVAADRREVLAAMGGTPVSSPAEVFRAADRILIAVFNTDQVEEVIEGKGGLVESAAGGANRKSAMVVSTCDPDRLAGLAARQASGPVHVLEVPISGASGQVAAGDGIGLVAGDRADADTVADILSVICKKCHYMGASGNGGRTKLAINLILGLNRTGLAEGLVFAETLGLPLPAFLDAAKDSAAYSQIMDVKGGKMVDAEFSPQGRIAVSAKDAHMMVEAAAAAGQDLPLGRAYLDILDKAMAAGDADLDNSAVIREIRRRRR